MALARVRVRAQKSVDKFHQVNLWTRNHNEFPVGSQFQSHCVSIRIEQSLRCRESRVEDEVAQELRASSGVAAADHLETNNRTRAAIIHS